MGIEVMTLKGSCLCGAVAYEVKGRVRRFYHCHCSRCRKASGTGHASNLMVQQAELSWQRGEDWLRRYKVPEAERFYTQFCSQCGSAMPRDVPAIDAVVIPAGSLDQELDIVPEARIFYDSRASWSCSGDGLPVFATYPSDRQ